MIDKSNKWANMAILDGETLHLRFNILTYTYNMSSAGRSIVERSPENVLVWTYNIYLNTMRAEPQTEASKIYMDKIHYRLIE